jgi:hypothetical protein
MSEVVDQIEHSIRVADIFFREHFKIEDFNSEEMRKTMSLSKIPKKRRTYYIRKDLDELIRAYAYWERLGLSEVVNLALETFFTDREIKEIPPTHSQSDRQK